MTTDTTISTSVDRVAAVGAIYAAFGRGDVPYILDQLSDDISWDEGIRDTGVPWLRAGRGTAHVVDFFTALGAGMQFTAFQPLTIAQSGNEVVAVISEAAIALSTGREIAEDLYVHVWRFDGDGKVASFRHIGDWHGQEQAVRATGT